MSNSPNSPNDMEDTSTPANERDIPHAVIAPRRRWSLPLVWLVPVVAVLVGAWLGVTALLQQGPTITIRFMSGEGLENGRTRIKYKEVDIGVVKKVQLAEDRASVIVTAEIVPDAENLLVDDTRFWVVRPRIASGGISGLGTLLSGAYVAMDAGKAEEEQRHFVGLEVPPILTGGLPGREFVLKSDDLGSLSYGTPVYFRRVEVGEVTAYDLDPDGKGVSVRVFIHAPYDTYVATNTRFWSASGIDVSVNAAGLQVDSQSLASILRGGIAFGTPPDVNPDAPAPSGATFALHENRREAYRREDLRVEHYLLVFRESVHGLQVGAPVEFRGIPVGEVVDIGVEYDPARRQSDIAVEIRLYPDRLRPRRNAAATVPRDVDRYRATLNSMVEGGFRAQVRTASLITGQLYIALDFFPNAPKARIDWAGNPVQLPTLQGGLQELQTTVTSIASKLDQIPYQALAGDLRKALQSLDGTLQTLDNTLKHADVQLEKIGTDVTPEIQRTLEQARKTLGDAGQVLGQESPLQRDLTETLREVSRAAESLRTLSDYLERHPESLIRGKKSEPSP